MEFKPITSDVYPILKNFFNDQKYALSSYSLFTIMVWNNTIFNNYYSIDNDVLFIAEENIYKPGNKYFLMPVSQTKEFTPAQLCLKTVETGIGQIQFVPEIYITKYGLLELQKYFKVNEQVIYNDYIYMAKDLSELKRKKIFRETQSYKTIQQ